MRAASTTGSTGCRKCRSGDPPEAAVTSGGTNGLTWASRHIRTLRASIGSSCTARLGMDAAGADAPHADRSNGWVRSKPVYPAAPKVPGISRDANGTVASKRGSRCRASGPRVAGWVPLGAVRADRVSGAGAGLGLQMVDGAHESPRLDRAGDHKPTRAGVGFANQHYRRRQPAHLQVPHGVRVVCVGNDQIGQLQIGAIS